ncbi:MAG: ABC transporter ATP-binding protein/permease [Endomicrobia bacterium]|nr:ABC transporter ATP-binding protein/permease [Endomicrobiia bacterium]MCL2506718.1 ABC transporter ATP-binding protein/permease [Endomicrobiia bacterium]
MFNKIKNIIAKVKDVLSLKYFSKMKRVWVAYILPQWKLVIISMVFMLLFGALEAYSVKLLKPVFDEVFIDKSREVLWVISIKIIIIFAVKGLANYIQSVTMTKVGVNFTRNLQGDLFEKVIAQDMDFFHYNNSGALITHFINDINMVREAVVKGLTSLVKDVCTVVALVVVMFWVNFEMAAITFFILPVAFYPIVYYGKKIKKIFAGQQLSFASLYSTLMQAFQGVKILKSYNLEGSETVKVKKNADAIAAIQMKMARNNNILSPLMEFFGGIAAAATLVIGGIKIMNGTLTPGSFIVFLVAIVAAYKPLKSLSGFNMTVQMGVIAVERIFTVMDKQPGIKNKPGAGELEVKRGSIKIKDVVFGYNPELDVLHGISMNINEGETVAIVGAAGSGKSTIINLLLRFYDVKSGSVEIDGQDIRDVTLQSLRSKIAFVSQDVVLFDDTIENNIKMGNQQATDEEAVAAAKNAAADNFITKQKDGYKTVVGERGGNLSGGQKQMVSIARAMLKNAPILLLDEATSSLDTKSERMVQEGLEKLMKGRTSIVIAHRLSTIINANKICVFDSGKIVEQGTHAELLALNGYYATLYNMQFKNHRG